jgi:deferrochelatase/peroxidase EfeB
MLGALAGGVALGAAGGALAGSATAQGAAGSDAAAALGAAVAFDGVHQAGIATRAQDRLHFAAFDVTTESRAELRDLLREWTAAARAMTAGRPVGVGAVDGDPEAPPDDTGEALGLPPAGLTLTVGLGPSLFDARFGFGPQRPAALADLPPFPADALEPGRSGGDLCIQACAYDEQVALHAVRNLTRLGAGAVATRYAQTGHAQRSGVAPPGSTPRNLMGFKDGTSNIDPADESLMREHVWASGGGAAQWMAGGSYLVTRRIRMTIEPWDRTSLREQEAIIGRAKGSGAPLSGGDEFTPPDFAATGGDGLPAIPMDAHVRLAHPDHNDGARMLRRGYHFVDGLDRAGRLDAGLFFMAYQRDPRRQFVPVQTRLARMDTLNEYIKHTGSGVWACPPGVRAEGFWADGLFA